MQIKRRKAAWLLVICMFLSVFTGMDPNSFLLKAEQRVGGAVIEGESVVFSYTTPGAYAVGLVGAFNGWKGDYDKAVLLQQKPGTDTWEVTKNKSDFQVGNNPYKFVTYSEINGAPNWEEDPNRNLYIAPALKSPVLNGDGTVTFNVTYSGEKLYLAGDFTDWDANEIEMTKADGVFTCTTSAPISEGTHQYKLKPNKGTDWKDSFKDPANILNASSGDNSIFIVPYLATKDIQVQGGTTTELSSKVDLVQEDNTKVQRDATYDLPSVVPGVTLSGKQLIVAESAVGTKFDVNVTADGKTGKMQVTVVAEMLKSPIINADKTVTFNAVSNEATLHLVGSMTNWGASPIAMTKNGNVFTCTTENPLAPGKYEYKFKPSAASDNWSGEVLDTLNPLKSGGNSAFVISGIVPKSYTAQVGTAMVLDEQVEVFKEALTSSKASATYKLKEGTTGINLVDRNLTVTSAFKGKNFVIEVSAGGETAEFTVNVVSVVYNYKIHYYRQKADFDNWNMWIWSTSNGGSKGEFEKTPVDGFVQAVHSTSDNKIGFKLRKSVEGNDWSEKDVDSNREIKVPAGATSVEVWLVQGDDTVYYAKPDLDAKVKNAFAESTKDVLVNLSKPATTTDSFVLKDDKGQVIATKVISMNSTRLKLTITDDTIIDPTKLYTVSSKEFKAASVKMRNILNEDSYYYEGDDLGLTYSRTNSTFKLWAPTATSVKVSIYDTADQFAGTETAMTRESTGVWSISINTNLAGKYYLYAISFADGTTNYVVDPYARATSVNGGKTAIIDLEATNPVGFSAEDGPSLASATDAVVYELHVRDFSAQGSPFKNPGKYVAFTESGLKTADGKTVGIDYLKELGITHVQLMPVYDYATVDETKIDTYNWGYDPQNYNVPEGSYATDPSNPEVRINEFKQMVKALHDEGIGVIMDVVYNHTFDVTTGPFEKIVPGYYYRTDDNGTYTNGSGCGNEVASERPMVRKYIKDSAKYWATEYGIDGFRFDLMGLIDTETVKQVTAELKQDVNPDMIVYGEPWTGGTSGLASELQTTKGKQKGMDFGVFNDNIRGAIKGDSDGGGKGFATGSTGQEKDIVEGVQGAIHTIATNPTEMISYVTAHDNLNLWDKVLATMGLDSKTPYSSITESNVLDNEAVKRSILANGIALTSQGVTFLHAGEEILRSKFGDHNSYKSPDATNMIRWENRDSYNEVYNYYKGLIALRKAHPAFRMTTGEQVTNSFQAYVQTDNVVAFTLKNYANGDAWKNIVVIYNANKTSKTVALPSKANWNVVVNEKQAGTTAINTLQQVSEVQVAPLSMMVLYDDAKNYVPEPTTLVLSDTAMGMEIGASKILKATVKDQNGAALTGQAVVYASLDEGIASVTSSGKVVAKAIGETTITATCGKATAEVQVKVVEKLIPKEIVISASKDYVYESTSMQLEGVVYDQFDYELINPKIVWSSSDQTIATVDSFGKVTGIKPGRVDIIATIGAIEARLSLTVKAYEKRYIVFEYIRPDQDYTDWNIWTWNTGVKDGQVDFTEMKDGKAIAYIEIGPETEGMGFLVRKGTNWDTAKQDIKTDRTVYTKKDQIVTKVRVTALVEPIEILALATAPVVDTEKDCIHFFYRDDQLFKTSSMSDIQKVQIEINDKLYDMTYDEKNEIFKYDYLGVESGKYYYEYIVTYKDGKSATYLDSHNNKTENNKSVIEYKKLDLTVKGTVAPGAFNFRESAVLSIAITSQDKEIDKVIKSIQVDLTQLGGKSGVAVDPLLKTITISATSEVTAGIKEIPIKVYDIFGNIYKATTTVEIKPQTSVAKDHFDWDEAVIYFMLTDRFNNGDTSNDDPLGNNYSEKDAGAYHGGDLKGVTNKLDYLKGLGINTIWITPIVEQVDYNNLYDKAGFSDVSYYPYHGYWAKNFEKLNPQLGTVEDLHTLIDEAHARDMKIMVDVVINHTGYGLKPDDSSTEKNFPTDEDRARFAGMLRTDGSTDDVYGELYGLPDFITEDPAVREKIIDWQVNWVENLGKTSKGNTIDYFRIDTAKHVDKATLQAFKTALVNVKSNFKSIAEASLSGKAADAYLNSGMADSILNFDFNEAANQFVNGQLESAEAYLEDLNNKATSAGTYGNFLGSHDEDGFLYKLGMSNTDKLLVAATLQATSKGQPVIYYGEEIGLSGKNNWPYYDNRYDMDWKKVAEGSDILTHYTKVLNIRKAYSEIFARGTRTKLAGSDAEGFMAFERTYGNGAVVVAINSTQTAKEITMKVPFKAESTAKDEYSGKTYVVSKDQMVTVSLPGSKEGGTVILSGELKANGGGSGDGGSSGSTGGTGGTTTTPKKDVVIVSDSTMTTSKVENGNKCIKVDATETICGVELSRSSVLALVDKKLGLELTIGNTTLVIPTAVLKESLGEKAEQIQIRVKDTKENATTDSAYIAVVKGKQIEITALTNNKATVINKLATPITVSIKLSDEIKASLKEGRKLGAYYKDEKGEWKFVGGKLEGNTFTFKAKQLGEYSLMVYNRSFNDLNQVPWAKENIELLAARHIITGKSAGQFAPKANVTRVEFAILLGKALGIEEIAYDGSIKDVKADSWYSGFVAALTKAGLISGYSDGTFKPDKEISRQEMAVLIMRAYAYLEEQSLEGVTDLQGDTFKDDDQIASWAKASVSAARKLGLISGQSGNQFSPNNNASRAEAASMLVKLLEATNQF